MKLLLYLVLILLSGVFLRKYVNEHTRSHFDSQRITTLIFLQCHVLKSMSMHSNFDTPVSIYYEMTYLQMTPHWNIVTAEVLQNTENICEQDFDTFWSDRRNHTNPLEFTQ